MKVTVKPKQTEKRQEIPFDEIPVGYVYVAKYSGGPIALKLKDKQAVLLSHGSSEDWFYVAEGFKDEPAYKILGKLTEVIVEGV